jgi:hypothetical protein
MTFPTLLRYCNFIFIHVDLSWRATEGEFFLLSGFLPTFNLEIVARREKAGLLSFETKLYRLARG